MEAPKTLKELCGFIRMVNGKLLPQYVASYSTHPYAIGVTNSSAQERSNTAKICLDERNANCIQPNESAYHHGRPLCLSKPIRSAKQDDSYGASNIILPCPGS